MKNLFSRYGGSLFVFGKGKASNEKLPEDQSLDNLLNHYATEIIEKLFFISSYDACPEYMGAYQKLPKNSVKIGSIEHAFYEVFMQDDFEVHTDIYITNHEYQNVYALFIRTSGEDLKLVFEGYKPSYDYVQTTFFRAVFPNDLRLNPKLMEIMLLILIYKMGINETDFNFRSSKTFLGKQISNKIGRAHV